MTTYIDSSALVAVYVPERLSAHARAVVRASGQLPFTPLHRLEVENAFELLVGRRVLTRDERDAVRQQLQDDIDSQRLRSVSVDLERVFADAAELSIAHSARLLTRSLDVLHVAAALALGCSRFVSADDRQIALSRALRLKTVDIKRPQPTGTRAR